MTASPIPVGSSALVVALLLAAGLVVIFLISQRRATSTPVAGTGADTRASIAVIAESVRSVAEVVGGFGERGTGAGQAHGGRRIGGDREDFDADVVADSAEWSPGS